MCLLASGKAYQLQVTFLSCSWNLGPDHDKTNKMTCVPSEDSDQPGQPPSLSHPV